jgi:hypothetical protein
MMASPITVQLWGGLQLWMRRDGADRLLVN